MISGLSIIEKELRTQIIEELDKVGILYRIFSRTKDIKSIKEKLLRKEKQEQPYMIGKKLMQDIIGVRVVTYFKDDIDIVYSILKSKFNFHSEEIDKLELTVFKPTRTNIICKFNKSHLSIFKEIQNAVSEDYYKLIDDTFELQLRTILSEGWHEIDHNLRYKCKEDWINHKENERMLNGIYASLETNDIALKSLFNELAYKHYKNKNWEGLIRNKFRLNFQLMPMDEDLLNILDNNINLGKQIIKVDRNIFINQVCQLDISLPINLNNIVYILNAFNLKDEKIFDVTPKFLIEELKL